jgi:tetratricopeptide (TPR) repeat protein
MRAGDRTASGAAFAVVVVLAAALLLARPAGAQMTPERQPRKAKVLGVAAFRNYHLTPETLFRGSDALPYDDALHASLAYVQERLGQRPDVELVSDRDLRERITSQKAYREGILLAREWFNLGVDHYRALRLDRALENLDRAEQLYLEVHQDLVEPYALAELELYRGLALAEKGSGDLAHIAFKRMFAFNPWRRFDRGYHAPPTEKALQAALVDFQLTVDRASLYFAPERIDRLLDDYGLDALLFGYVDQRSGGAELRVVVYERAPGRVAFRDTAPLTGGPDDIAAVDRLLTRWLACAEWPHLDKLRTALDSRLFLDVGVSYALFLVQEPNYFHATGFTVSMAWQLSRSFDLHGTFAVKSIFPDPDKDLVEWSTPVRLRLGAGFTFRSPRLRFYIHPGIDILYTGSMTWTQNPFCKFYYGSPAEDRAGLCSDAEITRLGTSWMGGIGLTTGLNVFLTTDLYLDTRIDSAAYFLPFEPTKLLNFPLDFTLAVGYAF